MAFLNSLNISGSGLTAQRLRMDVISQNISNAQTTRTEAGGPYRRKTVALEARESGASFRNVLSDRQRLNLAGVRVKEVAEDDGGFKTVYDPANPDADENGYVTMPNVDMVKEMIDLISANRSYEANITAFNAVKLMATKALEIGR